MKRRSFLKRLFGAAVAVPTVAKLTDIKDDNPYAPLTLEDIGRQKQEWKRRQGIPDNVLLSGTFPCSGYIVDADGTWNPLS